MRYTVRRAAIRTPDIIKFQIPPALSYINSTMIFKVNYSFKRTDLHEKSTNEDDGRLDITAKGLWESEI